MRIALLHYTCPPVPGGVERIVAEHAVLLARHGHQVTILCGEGSLAGIEQQLGRIQLQLLPELRAHASSRADSATLESTLVPILREHDVAILHNVLTMPFHPGLTAALWAIADRRLDMSAQTGATPRLIAWVHDIAACNPDYSIPQDDDPLALLRRAHPQIEYVAVSEIRQREFCVVTGVANERCRVIPNGIDVLERLQLSPAIRRLADEWRILERRVILLHPARLLKRKNIEWSLRVVAALRDLLQKRAAADDPTGAGEEVLLLLTAAPDPHNADSLAYARELRALYDQLQLDSIACWVPDAIDSPRKAGAHDARSLSAADVDSLFRLADALVFPSHQEGFGLPILEAAIHRLPIFCSDIEPLRTMLGAAAPAQSPPAILPDSGLPMAGDSGPTLPLRDSPAGPVPITFRLDLPAGAAAAAILHQLDHSPLTQVRKAALSRYGWPAVYRNFLAPLLSESESLGGGN